jgi:pimeloyl-ACP methyl ester carboxylesterase
VPVDGHRVHAYTGGVAFDPALPTVVFLHGAQHDHSVWILQSRYFAHHGHAVLALDLPGHGRSEGAPLPTIEALGRWVVAALDAFGVASAALVGHSMGSLIALEVAGAAPDRVSGIALVGTAFPMKVSDALLAAARDNEARAFDMINFWSHATINARPGSPAPGFSIFNQNRRLMERQKPGVLAVDFSACNAWQGGFERADALRCPALFVLGARDAMTQPRFARALIERAARAAAAAGVPAPRVVEIPDCGHAITAEAPDALRDALRTFLPASQPATLPR